MSTAIKKNAALLALLGYLVLTFFTNGYITAFDAGPVGVHQWRQADGASQAINYYQHDISFWTPQTHNLDGKNGFAASEFPLIYWVAGWLYRVFGPHDGIVRCLTWFFAFIGWISAFYSGKLIFRNQWLALIPVGMLVTLPYHQYYSFNFLPDMPAFGMALLGIYSWFRFEEAGNRKFIWLFAGASALGMLVKVSSGIAFWAVLATILFRYLSERDYRGKIKPAAIQILISSFLVIAVNLAWIFYVRWFNEYYGTGRNLLKPIPIWEMDHESIVRNLDFFWNMWMNDLMLKKVRWIFAGLFFVLILFAGRARRDLLILSVFVFLGAISYSMLFFRAFDEHDYYMINLAFFPFIVFIASVELLKRSFRFQNLVQILIVSGLLFILVTCLHHSGRIQTRRYKGSLGGGYNPAFRSLSGFMVRHGIPVDALVVSIPDGSPNISLYLMNRMGWSEIFEMQEGNMKEHIGDGAGFLVVSGAIVNHPEWYEPYMLPEMLVGDTAGIKIYRLQEL